LKTEQGRTWGKAKGISNEKRSKEGRDGEREKEYKNGARTDLGRRQEEFGMRKDIKDTMVRGKRNTKTEQGRTCGSWEGKRNLE
jgi:hypothetical protein